MLGLIDSFLAEHGVLIETQVSATKNDIAYLMMDIKGAEDPEALQVGRGRRALRVQGLGCRFRGGGHRVAVPFTLGMERNGNDMRYTSISHIPL